MKASLILEGGGMRGVYTAGVLEYFLEYDLEFPYIIGVSAGACQAVSYISKQKGRNHKITVEMVNNPNYIRYKGIIDGTGLFNMDFIFDEVPNNIVPFDYDMFRQSKKKLIAVATDCKTGKAIYLDCTASKTNEELNQMIRASSSLPLIAPVVHLNEMYLLDGGLADSIPVNKAISDGYKKNVIILTRPNGYRKKPSKGEKLYKLLLGKNCDGAIKALKTRYMHYNETLNQVEGLKKEGKAFVIQPSIDLNIKRAEKDTNKLEMLYRLGYNDAKKVYNELLEYIND